MRFYVSKCHNKLNGLPYEPEAIAPYICLNPYYNVTIRKGARVKFIIDSGAFQDVGNESRLSFSKALERQLAFEKKVSITKYPRKAEAIVSYDRLVDEQFAEEVGQFKQRVDADLALEYVDETIAAADYLSGQRDRLSPRNLILSCQGTTVDQYMGCIENVLDFSEPEDIIGFGGFCIISKSKDYEKQFYDVIKQAFPLIASKGIKRVHIFGVGMFRPLIQADVLARLNGLECSYDTCSPELNATFGRVFNPFTPGILSVYSKVHKNNGYRPAELALFNVKAVNKFWEMHTELPLPDAFDPDVIPRKKRRTKAHVKVTEDGMDVCEARIRDLDQFSWVDGDNPA